MKMYPKTFHSWLIFCFHFENIIFNEKSFLIKYIETLNKRFYMIKGKNIKKGILFCHN